MVIDYMRVYYSGSGSPTNTVQPPTNTPKPAPTNTPSGSCGTTNVALNKTATASSVTGTNTANLAVDGNTATRWESLYRALGGHGLVSTVGGYVAQFARREGATPVLLALAAVVAKAAGGLPAWRWPGPGGGSSRAAACGPSPRRPACC